MMKVRVVFVPATGQIVLVGVGLRVDLTPHLGALRSVLAQRRAWERRHAA